MDWKHWDGLADEQGPIPAFGPARTDEHGRVVMTDEEWEARRDATLRRSGRSGISPTRPTPTRSGMKSSAAWTERLSGPADLSRQ